MLFEIKNRFTGSVSFSLECGSFKRCVEAAVKNYADLSGANLSDADLSGAYLSDADLSRADLSGADLSGAYLSDADLSDADLSRANLSGADLSGAYLSDADLSRANLSGADLSRANLSGADLTPIRDDLWSVLAAVPREVAGLRQALIDGRVDGSTYEGECACLVGTIANIRQEKYNDLGALKPNSSRPIERFFMGINKGDTPETNQASALALQWTDEFLFSMREAFGK
ncbi:pentapeptide repeat-containing protein [Nitrosovibrio sp. Nv6]|uniref:pentapeptide repeat-containing protein n=1 Tax=Nitrosovibrio sp. Nv6 TaxID=1855340 RepID=UPI0008D6CAD3|nr:pentapeptide repeat-containing protein [Nitrosovibrio sp. Nv6]SEO78942.1 Pentapeptide repeat-containing protein [Nitrosovibrio sp. Nv6]